MDKNTVHELCFVILDRLARKKVRGFPFLPIPDEYSGFGSALAKWEEQHSLLEEERLAFIDHHTVNLSELRKILQSYPENSTLPPVMYFEKKVLRYQDKSRDYRDIYQPQSPTIKNAVTEIRNDHASRCFVHILLGGGLTFTPFFYTGDDKATTTARALREIVQETLNNFGIEKDSVEQQSSPVKSEQPEQNSALSPDFQFRRDGDIYQITYGGKEFPRINCQLGMQYIAYLLEHPGDPFDTPCELESAVRGSPTDPKNDTVYSNMNEDQLSEQGLSTQGVRVRAEPDRPAIREFKKRLDEVNVEIAKAERNNDPAQIDLLIQEKEALLSQLKAAKATAGKREWDVPNEQARKRVSAVIHRAIEAIESYDKENIGLAQHLRSHLTPISFPYGYSPDPPIDWIT